MGEWIEKVKRSDCTRYRVATFISIVRRVRYLWSIDDLHGSLGLGPFTSARCVAHRNGTIYRVAITVCALPNRHKSGDGLARTWYRQQDTYLRPKSESTFDQT